MTERTTVAPTTLLAKNFMPNIVTPLASIHVPSNDGLEPLFGFWRDSLCGRNDSMSKRVATFAGSRFSGERSDCAGNQFLSVLGVAIEELDDHLDGDRVV